MDNQVEFSLHGYPYGQPYGYPCMNPLTPGFLKLVTQNIICWKCENFSLKSEVERERINGIPDPACRKEYKTCYYVCRISENCKLNSMDSKNLAICWWPTLLPIEFSDMGCFEQMRPHLEDVLQTMIDQYPFLFCGTEAFVMVWMKLILKEVTEIISFFSHLLWCDCLFYRPKCILKFIKVLQDGPDWLNAKSGRGGFCLRPRGYPSVRA